MAPFLCLLASFAETKMPITTEKCKNCGEPVEVNSEYSHLKLDPNRNRDKHPRALHICKGAPTTLTGKFKLNPVEFMKAHVMVVNIQDQMSGAWVGKRRFQLKSAGKNAVILEFQPDANGEAIDAYWLPWLIGEATTMDLGDQASVFFTSQLTNCRFSVIDTNPKAPKVAHVAGNIMPRQRDVREVVVGFVPVAKSPLARRFSVSGSMRRNPTHQYAGTSVKDDLKSSAFVLGVRDDNGDWKFRAQIVKGDMSAGFTENSLTEDLQVLHYVDI